MNIYAYKVGLMLFSCVWNSVFMKEYLTHEYFLHFFLLVP